ncbi:MAG TPA: large-conductance mechanosensitive channel protein MscL [Lachnospiraceae bacterium]|nr:large-conductance mechanosensitive channel protein MscL [Lachnospiraceae bacterium]
MKNEEKIEKGKGFLAEFKKFITKGNVLDMAVGIIIGSAFTAIVTSLVNDVIMPVIGLILGGVDFSALSVQVGDATILYGSFIQAVVNFILIALTVFILLKAINQVIEKKEEQKPVPKPSEEAVLLSEIRDLLKEQK